MSHTGRPQGPGKSGNEWYCAEDIVDRIRRREARGLGETDYYLVEFLEYGELTEPAEVMLRRLKKLRDNGINTMEFICPFFISVISVTWAALTVHDRSSSMQ